MKTLYESIFDTFDDEGNVTTDSSEFIKLDIIDWINKNYHDCKIAFDDKKNKDGKYIVNSINNVMIKNIDLEHLTNGQFVWGIVKGLFDCSESKIQSLEGAPEKVGQSFDCSDCKSLKSLKGTPKEVGWSFYCSNCDSLESLEGAPEKVGGDFECTGCKKLKSLEGAPKEVRGHFCCYKCNSLKSLEGAPEKVGKIFYCTNCKSLKSLKGAPREVGGDFYCDYCDSLESLEGAPEKIGGDFGCKRCNTNFTEEDVKSVSNVKGKIIL